MNLSPEERAVMSRVMSMSPNTLARTRGITRRQADALQKYFVLVCECDRRHVAGEDYAAVEERALRVFENLPVKLRRAIQDD